ncbi:hypothetical protein BKA56DRAFT_249753 [Ilyonectria sp. MPI-CAGE-AT-0026]|nr:hypothetical protein BKA56DRAFT_249753 [Ilyonectria sp. MPI-CAGE-AT-0026]
MTSQPSLGALNPPSRSVRALASFWLSSLSAVAWLRTCLAQDVKRQAPSAMCTPPSTPLTTHHPPHTTKAFFVSSHTLSRTSDRSRPKRTTYLARLRHRQPRPGSPHCGLFLRCSTPTARRRVLDVTGPPERPSSSTTPTTRHHR